MISFGLGLFALTSCSDVADEITDVTYPRNFSPVKLEAKNVKETSATVQWREVVDAISYDVELFADDSLTFQGTPILTLSLTANEIVTAGRIYIKSVQLDNLVYDTKYSIRVRGVAEDASRTSAWSGAYFRTSAQQLFNKLDDNSVTDRSVILTWEAGIEATEIVVGDVHHALTADELAAGQATVDGLKPETDYTAYLYHNGKERGNVKFTTLADLTGATLIRSGEDLTAAIEAAESGAILAVYAGTYELNPNGDGKTRAVVIDKNLTIKGVNPTKRPTIKGLFTIQNGASFTLNQVIIDGSSNDKNDQVFNYKLAEGQDIATHESLIVKGVDFTGFDQKNKGVLYVNVAVQINEVLFDGCIFANMKTENDMFDCRKGYIAKLTIQNSTIYGSCLNRSMIRYDEASATFPAATKPVITIDHCTIDGAENENAASNMNGITYVRFGRKDNNGTIENTTGHEIVFTNNLMTNSQYGSFSRNALTDTPRFDNNAYYNCSDNYFKGFTTTAGSVCAHDESGANGENPKYKNASKGDYTIGNSNIASKKIGDPRWY
jgi:hypothetical protein